MTIEIKTQTERPASIILHRTNSGLVDQYGAHWSEIVADEFLYAQRLQDLEACVNCGADFAGYSVLPDNCPECGVNIWESVGDDCAAHCGHKVTASGYQCGDGGDMAHEGCVEILETEAYLERAVRQFFANEGYQMVYLVNTRTGKRIECRAWMLGRRRFNDAETLVSVAVDLGYNEVSAEGAPKFPGYE